MLTGVVVELIITYKMESDWMEEDIRISIFVLVWGISKSNKWQ